MGSDTALLVSGLREVVGVKRVAYLGGVRDTRRWSSGPTEAEEHAIQWSSPDRAWPTRWPVHSASRSRGGGGSLGSRG